MSETIPNSLEATQRKDTMNIKTQNFHFGIRLWKQRERMRLNSKDVAKFLGIEPIEYRRYESGEELPDIEKMTKLSKVLKVELSSLIRWSTRSAHKLGKETEGMAALKYSKQWNEALENFKTAYLKQYPVEKEVNQYVLKVLTNLERDVTKINYLPVLPMNLFMILDGVLNEDNRELTYLHEIKDFVKEGESLAGYVSRDPYFGPFVYQAAHKLYFHKGSSLGIEDCFNRLTIQQFKNILFAAIKNGIYSNYQELPALQQYHEFSSLGALMTRELKPYLPENVNFEHLYMAVLMQGMGTYAFYTLLVPSDRIQSEMAGKAKLLENIDDSIMNLINYEFHAVVAGMMAANWGFPEEAVRALIDHHKTPTESVSPLCAALKLVNYFVDCDFPTTSEKELNELLDKYPQLTMSTESLLIVANNMNQVSKHLIEMSSAIIESKVSDAAEFTSKRIKSFKSEMPPTRTVGGLISHQLPSRSESRFHPDYSKILSIECQALYNKFTRKNLMINRNESLDAYMKRMILLQTQLRYLSVGDINVVAKEFGKSPDEIKNILKL